MSLKSKSFTQKIFAVVRIDSRTSYKNVRDRETDIKNRVIEKMAENQQLKINKVC